MPYTVLIVDPSPETLARTTRAFADADFLVSTATTFEAAHPRLRFTAPELLVTDARLAAYNGVHLVVQARVDYPTIQAIVVDVTYDPTLGKDARAEGAVYVQKPSDPTVLVELARDLLAAAAPRVATAVPRRWPRKEVVSPLSGRLGDLPARVLDLSYGGLRLELIDATEETVMKGGRDLWIEGVKVPTAAVWAKRPQPGAKWWCGVEVQGDDTTTMSAWKAFVDSVG
jgi:DNA-binding response OmpR family regulator